MQLMLYPDGQRIHPGDRVRIADRYRGTVVACIDTGRYLDGYEQWLYLGEGIMVDTDFGGLIHYLDADELQLLRRITH
ncbi:hypothetical protein [Lysobacter sp. BMK333-48F3]|uniref:hypothetical protein n=1 Tax=Lysobacter sp. BMK333-48F3 TaxID=2867962 RepID=UPI002106DBAE|nr:hypothetical protein [Lysobacter sp. BMK333-48F3]